MLGPLGEAIVYRASLSPRKVRVRSRKSEQAGQLEVAPESLQLLRTLVAGDEGYPQWFQRASAAAQRLVTQSSSLAARLGRHR